MNKDGRYLITGGTGFLGRALIKRLSVQGGIHLIVLARDEGNLIALKDKFPDIEIIAGDIADPCACRLACKNVQGIFHLAGFKHVRLAEEQVYRCLETNIIGTSRLLEYSLNEKPEYFVFTSTDKAGNVNGVYGASKFLCEKMIEEYSRMNEQTKYRIVRYGNVWGSTGSIATRWPALMREGKEITVTDLEATRFYFTVNEAVELILDSLKRESTAPAFVKMKAVKLGTVVEACQDVYGKCPVKIIGLQPGENMHETIDGKTWSNEVEQYSKNEFIKAFLCQDY